MGNYECKYCGCPYDYYSSKSHSMRDSCLVSNNGYHVFQHSFPSNKIFGILQPRPFQDVLL